MHEEREVDQTGERPDHAQLRTGRAPVPARDALGDDQDQPPTAVRPLLVVVGAVRSSSTCHGPGPGRVMLATASLERPLPEERTCSTVDR